MIEETIKITEKILLTLIGIATVFATCQEIYYLVLQQKVQLADLLLLFIYTEVLGMVAIFYKSRRIPILLPLFIAITALSRMIILQGKGSDPQNLLYEAGAVLLLALACFIVTHKNVSKAEGVDLNNIGSNQSKD
ncbi:MAG: phosphate-starvation-inducible PsiE family protein [Paracoccaceae bacterium]